MWYNEIGPEQDVVLSTRVRLARNLADLPFSLMMEESDRKELLSRVEEILPRLGGYLTLKKMSELDEIGIRKLLEEHLISKERVDGVLLSDDKRVSVLVNEEDHLRIQAIVAGFDPAGALDLANRIDDALEEALPYAFDPEWGYLTSCATNMGTGLRLSVMVHLPALQQLKQIGNLRESLSKIGLTVRGLYGEGTDADGAVYQISNQITMGVTETELVEKVTAAMNQVIKMERSAVKELKERFLERFSDPIWRAYGILTYARRLSGREFMNLYSQVRLGVALGILPLEETVAFRELFVTAQAGMLMAESGGELSPEERDLKRAELVRSVLKGAI